MSARALLGVARERTSSCRHAPTRLQWKESHQDNTLLSESWLVCRGSMNLRSSFCIASTVLVSLVLPGRSLVSPPRGPGFCVFSVAVHQVCMQTRSFAYAPPTSALLLNLRTPWLIALLDVPESTSNESVLLDAQKLNTGS